MVPVELLPWPHNPFKCGLRGQLLQMYPDFEQLEDAERQHAFQQFISTRDAADFVACSYHDGEQPRAAAVAAQLLNDGVDCESRWDVADALPNERPEFITMVCDFFSHAAIRWDGQSSQLSNGQHRVCALKVAMVPTCVIFSS